jgi:hypothetical protein
MICKKHAGKSIAYGSSILMLKDYIDVIHELDWITISAKHVGAALVALDDFWWIDLVSSLRIDFSIFDAVAGLFVELIEADFLALAARGK